MATNKGGHRDYSRDINDPVRMERRMKLAHYWGLEQLERELWKELQETRNTPTKPNKRTRNSKRRKAK